MYTSLPAKFLIVSMWFNPNKVADKFEYCNAISLAYDGRLFQYDLQCVVFRFGCTADSGHYTAALKVGRRWVYYDDSPPSRKLATIDKLSDISGVPFMLLFKNPRE
jgi:ubiquitin C-terminal hydrolase